LGKKNLRGGILAGWLAGWLAWRGGWLAGFFASSLWPEGLGTKTSENLIF
jgi:hypothetical protein